MRHPGVLRRSCRHAWPEHRDVMVPVQRQRQRVIWQWAGARTQAPNGGSSGSVNMGDDQGSLAEPLLVARLQNCVGGNSATGAGVRDLRSGEFFPTLTGRPGAREERVMGGPAARGAQVVAALMISGPDRMRKLGRVRGSGLIGKIKQF
jgi:hypothetical protein